MHAPHLSHRRFAVIIKASNVLENVRSAAFDQHHWCRAAVRGGQWRKQREVGARGHSSEAHAGRRLRP